MKNIFKLIFVIFFGIQLNIQAKTESVLENDQIKKIETFKNNYTIKGSVTGFDNKTKIYISIQNEFRLTKIDSTEIKNGTFIFEGNTNQIEMAFLEIGSTQEYILPIILEAGKMNVLFDKIQPEDAHVVGTKNNNYLTDYNKVMLKLQKKVTDFQQQNSELMMQAQQNQDTETIDNLMAEYLKINEQIKIHNIEFIEKNNDAFISILLLEQLMNSQSVTLDEVINYYNALNDDIKNSTKGLELSNIIKLKSEVAVGQIAPDFSAPDVNNKTITLNENLGKVTILDFWAAWCVPCRQENPNLVTLYNKYKDQGLVIIGVSLDKNMEDWKNAIVKDKLTWIQVSNLKFWEDPIAQLYQVNAIPATFILDESGKIIAKDLTGKELEQKINEFVKK